MSCKNLEAIVSYCEIRASLIKKVIDGLCLREERQYVLEEELSKWRQQNELRRA